MKLKDHMYTHTFHAKNLVSNAIKRLVLVLCTVLFLAIPLSPSLYAQVSEAESLELKVVTLEQQFDAQVLNVLSNYFDSRKFFVDINIDAQLVDATYRTTENQIIRGGQQQQEENVVMPGLPFLPEENLQPRQIQSNNRETTQTIINEHTIQRLQILNLRVNVYADSSFSAEQVEFMRLIAGIAAKVNEARGDVVNVTLINMPDFGIDKLPPARAEDTLAANETILGSVKDYIPGFVLLLLIGLTLLVGRLTHTPSGKKSEDSSDNKHLTRDDLKENQEPFPKREFNESAARSFQSKSENSGASDFASLTNQFLNNSKEVALLFEFWMEEDQESGAERAAKTVLTIDKNLLRALRRELNPESYALIEAQLDSMDELTYNQKKEIAASFIEQLTQTNSAQNYTKHQQLELFQFLDHLQDYHIAQLLDDEDRKTSALLIDYLPEKKAARVLEEFGKDRATDIMMEMANLHKLSYSFHKETSSRLFSKAMDILDVEKELKQGAKNILRILDQLPLEDQNKYIEQLKATGSPVADIIANNFITLEKITALDDHLLKQAIAPIPTEVLLNAVAGQPENVTQKLLSVRPKREQRLIQMELQQMENINKEASDKAILAVMKAIRNAF